jgi:4-diphosphocytidyl-2-C-methyl-D-erythritol kinase
MLVFPNAKINIGLNIVSKREDGFHNLESIFYPIQLHDILEFIETEKKTSFTNTGLQIDSSNTVNLVIQAYNLLKNDYKLPNLKIHLHKLIPFGAGLGGGSSNAAFMLRALNDHFQLQLSKNRLEEYAQQLGSDCPFFINNNPVFVEGTGNIFSSTAVCLSNYYILLVNPNIHISTKLAFSEIVPKKPEQSIKDIIQQPIESWKGLMTNDFEKSIFKRFPKIEKIKNTLYESGAIYAQMSGSGSTIFGIFDKFPVIPLHLKSYFNYVQKTDT